MLAMRLFRRQKTVNDEQHTETVTAPTATTSDAASAERETLDDNNYQTVKAVPAFITSDNTLQQQQQQVKSYRKGDNKFSICPSCIYFLIPFLNEGECEICLLFSK